MTSHENEQERQPGDPSIDETVVGPGDDADTEGHSMLTLELGRTMDCKKVEVKGSISERIKKLLIVDEFKAAEAAAEPNEPK